jgi:hypothetical protein
MDEDRDYIVDVKQNRLFTLSVSYVYWAENCRANSSVGCQSIRVEYTSCVCADLQKYNISLFFIAMFHFGEINHMDFNY